MRSSEVPTYKYHTREYSQPYSNQGGYGRSPQRGGYLSEEKSQERYGTSTDDLRRNQDNETSPDNNLTYSSYEGSMH